MAKNQTARVPAAAGATAVADKANEEMVWIYFPPKEEREVNNNGTPGKLILDKDGRFPVIKTQEPRQIPRSRLAQAKAQGWYEDPNAPTYVYHASKKPKVIKMSELEAYLKDGWTTSPADHGKRYESNAEGRLVKAPGGAYPDMPTYVEDEEE